jgi:hypothetical protein
MEEETSEMFMQRFWPTLALKDWPDTQRRHLAE